jgi:hypothetical protein
MEEFMQNQQIIEKITQRKRTFSKNWDNSEGHLASVIRHAIPAIL